MGVHGLAKFCCASTLRRQCVCLSVWRMHLRLSLATRAVAGESALYKTPCAGPHLDFSNTCHCSPFTNVRLGIMFCVSSCSQLLCMLRCPLSILYCARPQQFMFLPTTCRYRTCGWLVERLQSCLSSNSRSGRWALPYDSLHIEALIDWAEKLLDDMGHKSQAQAGKVHWHNSLPLSSIALMSMLSACDTGSTALA